MKERITVTLDSETLNWVDKRIDEKVFASRSHAFEYLIKRAEDKEVSKDFQSNRR